MNGGFLHPAPTLIQLRQALFLSVPATPGMNQPWVIWTTMVAGPLPLSTAEHHDELPRACGCEGVPVVFSPLGGIWPQRRARATADDQGEALRTQATFPAPSEEPLIIARPGAWDYDGRAGGKLPRQYSDLYDREFVETVPATCRSACSIQCRGPRL